MRLARARMRGKRAIIAFAALLLVASVSGCKTPSFLCFKSSGLGEIVIANSDPSNNGGRPIAVDLVFITDKEVLKAVKELTARQYFERRAQIRRDYTKGYEIQSWELVPRQFDGPKKTSAPCNLVGTLIFADYASEGPHRIALEKERSGTVMLGADDLTWLSEKKK